MIETRIPLYLASASPRRRKLLEQIGLSFEVFSVDADETIFPDEEPLEAVKRLSGVKMQAARSKVDDGIIITADTIVVLGEKILGKPGNEEDAFIMLKHLSGRTHTVYTGYSIYNCANSKLINSFEATDVTFRHLTDLEIKDYIKTGSPMDKAGAYGIQDDFGAVFIERINGCYYNVVGLPLQKVYLSLKEII